jgi:hypothetical protein
MDYCNIDVVGLIMHKADAQTALCIAQCNNVLLKEWFANHASVVANVARFVRQWNVCISLRERYPNMSFKYGFIDNIYIREVGAYNYVCNTLGSTSGSQVMIENNLFVHAFGYDTSQEKMKEIYEEYERHINHMNDIIYRQEKMSSRSNV